MTREGGGPSWLKEKCDVPYGWPLLYVDDAQMLSFSYMA